MKPRDTTVNVGDVFWSKAEKRRDNPKRIGRFDVTDIVVVGGQTRILGIFMTPHGPKGQRVVLSVFVRAFRKVSEAQP